MKQLKAFLQTETVLLVAAAAAGITMFFVPPSAAYFGYINYRVLTLLFCLMAVVSGFQKIGLLALFGQKMVAGAHNTRLLCMALILLCFFSSMVITNDVALLTFVPFSILILKLTGQTKNTIYVIVLETVAANLGSMLTPVGNPQNLYLYTTYHFTPFQFFCLMLPVTGVSLLLLLVLCFGIRAEHIQVRFTQDVKIADRRQLIIYLILFGLCLFCVFQILPYPVLLILIVISLFFTDKLLFRRVDYGLLLTFVCFFIFVGNIGQMETIRSGISHFIEGREEFAAVLLSQVISNVPAAVLISGFTGQAEALLIGVNIGGLGTLVASLASLISFKLYARSEGARMGRYLLVFSAVNAGMLLVLLFIFR